MHNAKGLARIRLAALVAICSWAGAAPAMAAGWFEQPMAIPEGSVSTFPLAVSCATARSCVAVGYYNDSQINQVALAEDWDGTRWSVVPTDLPDATASSILTGVSCPRPGRCIAVGEYTSSRTGLILPLAEHRSGGAWELQRTAPMAQSPVTELDAVSCTSPNGCSAVGSFLDPRTPVTGPLEGRWDGVRWSLEPAPGLELGGGALTGVSCPASRSCTAVGSVSYPSGQVVTLAERWNGARWSMIPTPNPPSREFNYELLGVSCATQTLCMAVGPAPSQRSGAISSHVVERWNGRRWSLQPAPGGDSSFNGLLGVSCPSSAACAAVGYTGSMNLTPWMISWNGSRWTVQHAPSPPESLLSAVSCSAPESCTAVGYYSSGVADMPFADHIASTG
jgi:hypothetical protein